MNNNVDQSLPEDVDRPPESQTPLVGALINRFRQAVIELEKSAQKRDATLHAKHTAVACRLSRRIRLRLGNPYRIDDDVKQVVVSLFGDCVKTINLSLNYPADIKAYVTKCRDNIGSRAAFIEHPEMLEEELEAMGA